MLLVTQTDILAETIGYPKTIELLKNAGFDAMDLSLFTLLEPQGYWSGSDWREKAQALKALAEAQGIGFRQAHAPFPTTRGDREFDEMASSRILRAMEIASMVGAPCIVVHPVQHLSWVSNKKALFDASAALYRKLIPWCEKWNIVVCTENMWQWDTHRGVITDSICSQPEEFRDLIDQVNSPWIRGCLDIGHCALVGVDPAEAIRTLGAHRLKALHVHDVDYRRDCHTMPYTQDLEWGSITAALGEIGYTGEFTFEANIFIAKLPQPLWPTALKLMEETGRYLMTQVEAHKN